MKQKQFFRSFLLPFDYALEKACIRRNCLGVARTQIILNNKKLHNNIPFVERDPP